jgi:formamidopyrimidine-DNA glycosylase
MPELPEVETIARGVDTRVRGDRILHAWFGSHKEPFKNSPSIQMQGIEGRTILGVERVGKHIVCNLGFSSTPPKKRARKSKSQPASNKSCQQQPAAETPNAQWPTAQWIVHLGMTGRLLVTTPDAPVAAHTHARLTLASGRELRFVDPRRFGRLEFRDLAGNNGLDAAVPDALQFLAPRFAAPGAEPLSIQPAEFAALFRGRRLAIKAGLLNQKLLSGVGNIYADESLFRAGIRPRRSAGRLTRIELERLRLALHEVLQHAIRLGGSSVSDYVDAEGVRGFFQLEHCVYQRTGQPCLTCKTPIKRITIAGRSTHYCPHCQP